MQQEQQQEQQPSTAGGGRRAGPGQAVLEQQQQLLQLQKIKLPAAKPKEKIAVQDSRYQGGTLSARRPSAAREPPKLKVVSARAAPLSFKSNAALALGDLTDAGAGSFGQSKEPTFVKVQQSLRAGIGTTAHSPRRPVNQHNVTQFRNPPGTSPRARAGARGAAAGGGASAAAAATSTAATKPVLLREQPAPAAAAQPSSLSQAQVATAGAAQQEDVARKAHASPGAQAPQRVLTGVEVLRECPELLTDFERKEIEMVREVSYIGTQASKLAAMTWRTFDDNQGNYCFQKGGHIAWRYEQLAMLGKGSFGQVWSVRDHGSAGKPVIAIKVIKNKPKFHQQARVELAVLQLIKREDLADDHHLIHILESVEHRKHMCFTFPRYSINLYQSLKSRRFKGYDTDSIRTIMRQLVKALAFLHAHGIIHCDIKPENVLLEEPGGLAVRLIDFGSACFEGKQIFTYIQSRFYRAPEVILGLPYSTPIDWWSAACMLAELRLGQPLFPGENEADQLSRMMEVLGVPSAGMLAAAKRSDKFFDAERGYAPLPPKNTRGPVRAPGAKALGDVLVGSEADMLAFLHECLRLDPSERAEPARLAEHRFLAATPPGS